MPSFTVPADYQPIFWQYMKIKSGTDPDVYPDELGRWTIPSSEIILVIASAVSSQILEIVVTGSPNSTKHCEKLENEFFGMVNDYMTEAEKQQE